MAAAVYDPLQVDDFQMEMSDHDFGMLTSDHVAWNNEGPWLRTVMSFTMAGKVYGPYTVGVHLKGAWGSWRDVNGKAGFKIKMDAFVKDQTLFGITKFTLNNMVQDPSYIHEAVTYRLFRALGVPAARVGYANVTVDFAWLESSGYAGVLDRVDVMWSTNGTTWNTAGTFNRYNAVQGWKIKSQALPAGANNQATLYIAYQFTSAYGNDCYLDLTHITASPSATGTLAGTVTNAVGGAAISGASVVVNALAHQTIGTASTSIDTFKASSTRDQ